MAGAKIILANIQTALEGPRWSQFSWFVHLLLLLYAFIYCSSFLPSSAAPPFCLHPLLLFFAFIYCSSFLPSSTAPLFCLHLLLLFAFIYCFSFLPSSTAPLFCLHLLLLLFAFIARTGRSLSFEHSDF